MLFTLQKRIARGIEAGDLVIVTADTLHLFEGAEDTANFFTPGKITTEVIERQWRVNC